LRDPHKKPPIIREMTLPFCSFRSTSNTSSLSGPQFSRTLAVLAVELVSHPKQRTEDHGAIFAGQNVGIKQTDDHIWLVIFMHYDLGYFDDETCKLEPLQSPFGPKVIPMSPE
jgi:hypothetical protein